MKSLISRNIMVVLAIAVLTVINYNGLFAQESEVTTIEWRGEEVKVFSNTVVIRVSPAYRFEMVELSSRIQELPVQVSINMTYGFQRHGLALLTFEGNEVTIKELIKKLIQLDEVEMAKPEIVDEIASPPNDSYFEFQWNLNNTGEILILQIFTMSLLPAPI